MTTMAEKLKCVERELKMRRRVYPRWVEAGRMTHESAQREISIMEKIVEDYKAMAEQEAPTLL